MRRTLVTLVVGCAVATVALIGCSAPADSSTPPPATTTPPQPPPPGASGVTSKLISQATVDGKDVIVRQIVIAPGGSTGWHYHDGDLHGWVVSGTLTHFDSNCTVDGVYTPGQSVTEPAGPNRFHIGRNLGEEPMVLDVVYVLPAGSPLSENVAQPPCDHRS